MPPASPPPAGLPMKVLVVSQYFWPESFRINDVVLGLQERGHQVEVLTGFPNYPDGTFFAGYPKRAWLPMQDMFRGAAVRRVPLLPRRAGRGPELLLNYLSFALSASLLGPGITHAPDVILVFEPSPVTVGWPAAVLRRRYGVPMAFWVQDLWPESLAATNAVRHPGLLALVGRMVRWIYARSDLLLVQSRTFTRSLVDHGACLHRIEYLPNSAEAFYRPVEVPPDAPERAMVPAGFVVMFAGNLGVSQDLESLLGAAQRLRDEPVRWVILGEGRQRPWLEQEIARRGLQAQVKLLGAFPAERMPHFFALADALLVSLKADPAFESTLPSKVQSYLACGRPVIAALNGEGARVTLEAGAGVAPGAENPEALAAAVRALARLPVAEREAMGRRGRSYFLKHFEREAVLSRLEDLLTQLVRTPPLRKDRSA